MSSRAVSRRVGGALVSWLVVATAVRVVIALPEHCPAATPGELMHTAEEAVAWLARNQNDDGTWLYRYEAESDTVVGGYNTVRHAGVTMSLYQAADHGVAGALEVADTGTAYALDHLVPHDDWVAFEPESNRVTTGAAALLVAGLVERRQLTGDTVHDELMRALSRFLVAHVEANGAVAESWDRQSERPRFGIYSPFFTGEVLWALASMHLVFPDEGWDEPAERIAHYVATDRDDAEDHYPDIPDHWAAYGMWVMTQWSAHADLDRPLTADQVPYVERQAAFGGLQARWESQRVDSFPRYALRGRRTLGAGLGTVGEQITGLWQVARTDERLAHLVDPLGERALCVAGMLAERQVSESEANAFDDPSRVRGAWFQFGVTQMDDQQHALSAVLLALPIAEEATQ